LGFRVSVKKLIEGVGDSLPDAGFGVAGFSE
jgi:hypothetical protein